MNAQGTTDPLGPAKHNNFDIDEGPISQRLKRRDGSKPPPSYSGHDGDEESSDEDVGGESVEGSEAGQAGGAQAASSSNTNPPRQTFSCSICARDFGTANQVALHALQDAQLHARGPRLQWAHHNYPQGRGGRTVRALANLRM